jgi:hypothetical protein
MRRAAEEMEIEEPVRWYAIVTGWISDIVTSSEDEVITATHGYVDPDYRVYDTEAEAEAYIRSGGRAQELWR